MSAELTPFALPEDVDVLDLARTAREVAVAAGELITRERPEEIVVTETKSSRTDVVTAMDQASQDLLRSELLRRRPGDGFAGEERGGAEGTTGITWVVDPIDGTVNYLYGLAAFAVSVAAVVGDVDAPGGWRPVAAAVVNPVSGEEFGAALGRGAWRHTRGGEGGSAPRPLRVAEPESLAMALCATGFGYAAQRRRWQGRVIAELLPQVRDIRRLGSAALDLCRVADGTVDVYFERGLNPWDKAAGWLVATEAGALVGDLDGGPPSEEMTVAGAPAVQGELRAALQRAIAQVGVEQPS